MDPDWLKKRKSMESIHFTVFEAIQNNNFDEFMKFLNKPDFDPNVRLPLEYNPYNNPLLMICTIGIPYDGKYIEEKYIEALLKKKSLDLNLQNDDGWTALMTAA